MGKLSSLYPQIRGAATRCSTGCCWIALSSRWSYRMTKVTTLTSHHWRILTWRTLSGCESPDYSATWISAWNRLLCCQIEEWRTVFVFLWRNHVLTSVGSKIASLLSSEKQWLELFRQTLSVIMCVILSAGWSMKMRSNSGKSRRRKWEKVC